MAKIEERTESDRAREWWANAQTTLRNLARGLDRLRRTEEAGQEVGFTLAQLRTMEAGIDRALGAVADTVPAA